LTNNIEKRKDKGRDLLLVVGEKKREELLEDTGGSGGKKKKGKRPSGRPCAKREKARPGKKGAKAPTMLSSYGERKGTEACHTLITGVQKEKGDIWEKRTLRDEPMPGCRECGGGGSDQSYSKEEKNRTKAGSMPMIASIMKGEKKGGGGPRLFP